MAEPRAAFDPANDPWPGDLLRPATDYGLAGDRWHRLLRGPGRRSGFLALCGAVVPITARTTISGTEPGPVCPRCNRG